ncbi:radical SAM/SPASM domain-containing protein [Candidatus Neomarinimicrobiota bacterium]
MTLAPVESHVSEMERLEYYLEEIYCLSERVEAFRKNKLYTLEIELSRQCNLECIYCYNASTKKNGQHVDPRRCMELLDEANEYGIKEIYWLGGETLLYPFIEDILCYSKTIGLRNIVFTNGTCFDNDIVRLLNDTTDWLVLHLDTLDPTLYAQLHNLTVKESENVLNIILEGVDLLLSSGFPSTRIRISVVLSRLSLPTLDKTLNWARNTKCFHSSILICPVALGRSKTSHEDIILSEDDIHYAYTCRSHIENRPELLKLGSSEFCKHYELTNCYIDVSGNVCPYVGIQGSAGNAYKSNIGDILFDNYPYLSFQNAVDKSSYKNKLEGKCGSCNNQQYCFGTRTYSFLQGDGLSSSPHCWETVIDIKE